MPIVTPRLVLRPPTLGDLDSIQTAKEEAWPDLQLWMSDVESPSRGMTLESPSIPARGDAARVRTLDFGRGIHKQPTVKFREISVRMKLLAFWKWLGFTSR